MTTFGPHMGNSRGIVMVFLMVVGNLFCINVSSKSPIFSTEKVERS
jgi:hypothetical protein